MDCLPAETAPSQKYNTPFKSSVKGQHNPWVGKLSVRGQIVHIFKFAGYMVSVSETKEAKKA